MPELISAPPVSAVEPVTEILHGMPVTDPYRWLEDQNSPRTREWICEQTRYARSYLDNIPGRERIRERIREFLAVESYDSLQKVGNRYFFRKRLPEQEQPCIYMRKNSCSEEELLVDPSTRGRGKYAAVKPLRVSPDGKLLLYQIKEGGERTSAFELLDIETRTTLPDALSRGHLRGFAFAPDSKSFYYVYEPLNATRPFYMAAFHHILGTSFAEDREVFFAAEDQRNRVSLISDEAHLGFLVYQLREKTLTSLYIKTFESEGSPQVIAEGLDCSFGPRLFQGRIFAITDRDAPNLRIVELSLSAGDKPKWESIVPECGARIRKWVIARNRMFVLYARHAQTFVSVFDFSGTKLTDLSFRDDETVRLVSASPDGADLFIETESFTEPPQIWRYSMSSKQRSLWAKKDVPFETSKYAYARVSYTSKDGTHIPMFLMGRHDVLESGTHPMIMTAYGGYGISMSPQFSAFIAFLVERGCLFALPGIRGGSEFGTDWHNAAKRQKRQNAYDDFVSAAEWLITTGRTTCEKLAIFGGSNSGLLVAAAMTQRPDLFRAVVAIAPLTDMLRYHLFDCAHLWKEEFGTADNPDDFKVLSKYSPYHQIRDDRTYPAVMIVSGDADTNCNSLHARKMTARLQAAASSLNRVLLDYSPHRGHSPVLPLSDRIEGLTDRMAFLSDRLGLTV